MASEEVAIHLGCWFCICLPLNVSTSSWLSFWGCCGFLSVPRSGLWGCRYSTWWGCWRRGTTCKGTHLDSSSWQNWSFLVFNFFLDEEFQFQHRSQPIRRLASWPDVYLVCSSPFVILSVFYLIKPSRKLLRSQSPPALHVYGPSFGRILQLPQNMLPASRMSLHQAHHPYCSREYSSTSTQRMLFPGILSWVSSSALAPCSLSTPCMCHFFLIVPLLLTSMEYSSFLLACMLISQPHHIQHFSGYLGPLGVSYSKNFLCVFHHLAHGDTQLTNHPSFLSTQLYLRGEETRPYHNQAGRLLYYLEFLITCS